MRAYFGLLAGLCVLGGMCGVAEATRPLTIEDTSLVGDKVWMVDGGVLYSKDSSDHTGALALTLAYGVTERLEVGVGNVGATMLVGKDADVGTTTVAGWSDPYFYVKFLAVTQEEFPVSVALLASITTPIGSTSAGISLGSWDYEAEVIVTREIEEWGLGIDANVAFLITDGVRGADPADYFRYGIAVRKTVTEKLNLVGEVYAFTPTDKREPTTAYVNVGFQLEVLKDLWLDAAVGTGLNSSSSDVIGTVGFTVYF